MLGTLLLITAAAAASPSAQTLPAQEIVEINRGMIEQIVRDYLLDHPEIIPEAMTRLKDKQIAHNIASHRKAVETPYGGAWEGAAEPDVTVVEFFDYACGYCRITVPEIARLVSEDKKIRIVYREMPILTPVSREAARVALLAARKGNYMAFHNAAFVAPHLTHEAVLAAAQGAGIDAASAEAAIASKSEDGEIDSNLTLFQEMQGTGTPTFVIGNQIVVGAVGYDGLKQAIAKARVVAHPVVAK